MKTLQTDLWSANHPRNFWQCQRDLPEKAWDEAITRAFSKLGFTTIEPEINNLLALSLGEARFGEDHWNLSLSKKAYYLLKPMLPRALTRLLRRIYSPNSTDPGSRWPIESRYVDFLWAVMSHLLNEVPSHQAIIKSFWPEEQRFALVLTHDVETARGQEYVRRVADMEQSLSLRSSFNFVPERYRLDMRLLDDLRERGFEIGIHGLKHDGKLFSSRAGFQRRAVKINCYLKELGAAGFRAPLTHRNPGWMQDLNIEYDLSFFDTDPFEPIPGGTMSIWPFFIGRFVELPYTLVQDYTLTAVLGESTPRIWLEKLDYIERFHGMALLNSHPDYLREPSNLNIYGTFLSAVRERSGYWHALPRDVARWWRERSAEGPIDAWGEGALAGVRLVDGRPAIEPIQIERHEAA